MSGPNQKGWSVFKRAQSRHRRQGAAPNRIDDVSEFLDFSNHPEDDRIFPLGIDARMEGEYGGLMFGVSSYPGFMYAPQALAKDLQEYLAYLSVSKFCEAPHATNIELVKPKAQEVCSNIPMWEQWKQDSSRQVSRGNPKAYRSFKKLSWATMGYQYDWTARAYHEGAKSPVPAIIHEIAQKFARISLRMEKAGSTQFHSSACIVNYYNVKSIMGGHRDDLEFAVDKPVISFSFGLPAVFLLGGKTKDSSPVLPILVRPGDVMILGGDSRMNYHGMARLIPWDVGLPAPKSVNYGHISREDVCATRKTNQSTSQDSQEIPQEDRDKLATFLEYHRININVRQVLPDGVTSIEPTAGQTM